MEAQQVRRNRLIVVSVIIILIVTLTPGNGKILGNYLDKVGHFMVFFFLSINLCYKYQKNEALIGVLFGGILFGFLTEFLQQFIPGRNMDIYDAVADTLGIIFGFYFYRSYKNLLDKLIIKFGG